MYNKDDNTSKETDQMTDETNMNVSGHILIRDKETGEELVNKRNAIHYGNLGALIAAGLQNQSNKIIHFMAFGNGGSSVDSSGTVLYKAPTQVNQQNPQHHCSMKHLIKLLVAQVLTMTQQITKLNLHLVQIIQI